MPITNEFGKLVAKRVYTLFLSLALLKDYVKLPPEAGNLILFMEKNFERGLTSEEIWEKTGVSESKIAGLTDKTIFILWTCLEFTREVNAFRKAMGYSKVNFLEEATFYDKEQKASQQQRAKADQEGQD